MKTVNVVSSEIKESATFVKFRSLGKNDVQDIRQVTPYGIDSNPVPEMVGIYTETGVKGESVLIGYINKSAISKPGEMRVFSTDANGVLKAVFKFRNDGKVEMNGDDDNLVRYLALKAGFDQLKDEVNAQIDNWNSWCNTYLPGGPTVVGSPLNALSLVTANATASIDDSKVVSLLTSQ